MASTKLSRTLGSGSATNKFTYSTWLKYSGWVAGGQRWFSTVGTGDTYFRFNEDGTMEVSGHNSSASSGGYFITNRVFDDHASWYHIVIRFDSTESSASNRLRLYINGVQEESFSTYTDVNQNATDNINLSGNTQIIGGTSSSQYFNGLMAQTILSIGYSYAPTTFGEVSTTSGEWKPKPDPSLSYGTNGFNLSYETSSALGDDTSGNTNDFTLSGSGTPTLDSPSNTFATWNPLNYVQANNSPVLTNGNTKMTGSADAPFPNAISTLGIPKSGKYYAEFKMQNNTAFAVGICDMDKGIEALRTANTTIYNTTFNGAVSLKNDGSVIRNGAETNSVTPTIATGDIAMIAYDADNGAFYAGRNGTWGTVGGVVGVPTSGSSKTGAIDISAQSWFTTSSHQGFLVGSPTSGGYAVIEANFGNGYFGTTAVTSAGTAPSTPGTFEYAVPTSYQPLSTKGLNV